MGKGDRRSKRGKIILGSYGKTRPRKKKKVKNNSQENSESKE